MTPTHSIQSESSSPRETIESAHIETLLHSLSNKLLPIVVFSELAIRRCDDIQLRPQLEKIHGAAKEARDILVEIRNSQEGLLP